MSYLSDWREAEEAMSAARAANPLCDESETCPAPDDGHLVGCRSWPRRLREIRRRRWVETPGGVAEALNRYDDRQHAAPLMDAVAAYLARGDAAEEARVRAWIAEHPQEAWEALGVGIGQLEALVG